MTKKNLNTPPHDRPGRRGQVSAVPAQAKQNSVFELAAARFRHAGTFNWRKFCAIHYMAGAACGLILSLSAEAFDENRLWLPITYQTHYLRLKEAAASAESLERCEEMLSGTLDRDRSSRDHPVFRITCRQPDGQTYNEMVDGLSFETLTTSRETKYKLTDEELAQKKLAEERRQQAEKEKSALLVCKDKLQQRVRGMKNIRWLNKGAPEPVSGTDDELVYIIDFDAEAYGGEALHYRSTCHFRSLADFHLKIGKR